MAVEDAAPCRRGARGWRFQEGAAAAVLPRWAIRLRTQIDQIAKDSGFNGTNLLGGDALSVIFNEKTGSDQSKLTIAGRKLTAESLGISQAVNGAESAGEFNMQTDKGAVAPAVEGAVML